MIPNYDKRQEVFHETIEHFFKLSTTLDNKLQQLNENDAYNHIMGHAIAIAVVMKGVLAGLGSIDGANYDVIKGVYDALMQIPNEISNDGSEISRAIIMKEIYGKEE